MMSQTPVEIYAASGGGDTGSPTGTKGGLGRGKKKPVVRAGGGDTGTEKKTKPGLGPKSKP